jgi:hypothetical protein
LGFWKGVWDFIFGVTLIFFFLFSRGVSCVALWRFVGLHLHSLILHDNIPILRDVFEQILIYIEKKTEIEIDHSFSMYLVD